MDHGHYMGTGLYSSRRSLVFVNRRPNYKLNKDLHDIIELGKKDALLGGEVGAYYSALPPGFKWAATSLPRFVVWILILLLSPFTFLYAAYENYEDNRKALLGVVGVVVAFVFAVVMIQGMISKKATNVNRGYSSNSYDQGLKSKNIPAPSSVNQVEKTQQTLNGDIGNRTSFHTALSGNYKTEQEARTRANQLKSMGFDSDVLFSSNWSNLNPGYWVAYSGRFSDNGSAQARVNDLKKAGQDAYVRFTGNALNVSLSDSNFKNQKTPVPEGQDNVLDVEKSTAHYNAGIKYAKTKRFQDAISEYQEAVRYNPDNLEAYNLLGYTLLRIGDPGMAIVNLKKAVNISNSYIWGHYNLSLALLANNNDRDALNEIKIIIGLDPDFKATILQDGQFKKYCRNQETMKEINRLIHE